MRFSTLSLFAVCSLFANAFAVPTTVQRRGVTVSQVEERDVPKICTIVSGLLEEVKGCTYSINVTISTCEGIKVTETVKTSVITSIQGSCHKMVSSFSTACFSIGELEFVELAEEDLKFLVSCCVEIILEIVCTLLHCIKVLGCTITELLGFLLPLLCNAFIALLSAIGCVVGNFTSCIKAALECYLSEIVKCFGSFAELLECL